MKTHYKSNQKIQTSAVALLNLVFFFSASEKAEAQNTAGIIGIDHVGINVPDLNQGITFFSDVLGFKPVTQLGPIPLDASWKEANHINPATGAVTIKMINAGTGASIEVFSYADNKGSKVHPNSDDIGASHIAFYTSDINESVKYLKSKGVKILGEPYLTPSGDTAGESWVYFETPWGSKMELVSYQNGKGYEKNNPSAILWSPKDTGKNGADKPNSNMLSESEIKSLVELHLAIWNEKDLNKRDDLMKKVYAENIQMVDSHFIANGYKEINGFVDGLQKKSLKSRFSPVKAVDVNHNIARLYWQNGPAEKPDAVTGMDLFVFENGKAVKLYVFVDSKK
ncbi:catechol 2,3-dioxygenase-like lactoylglutathione lyase family enzyme [Flavobacterium sp. 270]|uniref:VOC family protein n=1 Tax=Flavobacterium sp. 270 TaxID=2512114 RepID=UPI001066464C|nr:VOC family protein [Flavobacterium sp. 270]TDW46649.1 catechol 2,3-dioxygenase-like lactoylglutathione lyase family enzyme [Flavobacterium sp. 270]